MGIMGYSLLLWVMQDLYYQPYPMLHLEAGAQNLEGRRRQLLGFRVSG